MPSGENGSLSAVAATTAWAAAIDPARKVAAIQGIEMDSEDWCYDHSKTIMDYHEQCATILVPIFRRVNGKFIHGWQEEKTKLSKLADLSPFPDEEWAINDDLETQMKADEAWRSSLETTTSQTSILADETFEIQNEGATLSNNFECKFNADEAVETIEKFEANIETLEHPSKLCDVCDHPLDGTNPLSSMIPQLVDFGECDVYTPEEPEGGRLYTRSTALTTVGSKDPVSTSRTMLDTYGNPPKPTVVPDHECCTIMGHSLSDETQLPNPGELTVTQSQGKLLSLGDSPNQPLSPMSQHVTSLDFSNQSVMNGLDFDITSDRNLSDEIWSWTSGTRPPDDHVFTSCDPIRLGKLGDINFNTPKSMINSIDPHGQHLDHLWKYSANDGQLGSCGGANEIGTRESTRGTMTSPSIMGKLWDIPFDPGDIVVRVSQHLHALKANGQLQRHFIDTRCCSYLKGTSDGFDCFLSPWNTTAA